MTPNDIIAWARSMQGFPAVARDGADAKTDLLLVSEAIHEIAGELPIKGESRWISLMVSAIISSRETLLLSGAYTLTGST